MLQTPVKSAIELAISFTLPSGLWASINDDKLTGSLQRDGNCRITTTDLGSLQHDWKMLFGDHSLENVGVTVKITKGYQHPSDLNLKVRDTHSFIFSLSGHTIAEAVVLLADFAASPK